MKIRYGIARGYAGEISKHGDRDSWVKTKYGNWIEANVTLDFTITDITDTDFIVVFGDDADGESFVRQLGGKVVD